LRTRIEAFIASGGREGSFDELALELFAYQYDAVPMYRRLCHARGVAPGQPRSWHEIPAIPVDAFRHGLVDSGTRPHVFLSSGTTSGFDGRSVHALSTLDTYKLSALSHFQTMALADGPGPMAVLVLGPTAATHPQSSLGAMFSWIVEACSNGNVLAAFDASGNVALGDTIDWLRAVAGGSAPVLILGVSSAITAILDETRRRRLELRLPADSRLVDTGGRKAYGTEASTARTFSPRALLKAAWRFLHVPAYMCVNEYGMTEMLSQFYDDALLSRVAGRLGPRAKVGPPWVRTTIVDPVTLAPVGRGEQGILRHCDLANVESVASLQTLDIGREAGAGFALLGRAKGAQQRGCSALLREVTGEAVPSAGER
jgi:hypothetical protein